jgi:hypothetical protein
MAALLNDGVRDGLFTRSKTGKGRRQEVFYLRTEKPFSWPPPTSPSERAAKAFEADIILANVVSSAVWHKPLQLDRAGIESMAKIFHPSNYTDAKACWNWLSRASEDSMKNPDQLMADRNHGLVMTLCFAASTPFSKWDPSNDPMRWAIHHYPLEQSELRRCFFCLNQGWRDRIDEAWTTTFLPAFEEMLGKVQPSPKKATELAPFIFSVGHAPIKPIKI